MHGYITWICCLFLCMIISNHQNYTINNSFECTDMYTCHLMSKITTMANKSSWILYIKYEFVNQIQMEMNHALVMVVPLINWQIFRLKLEIIDTMSINILISFGFSSGWCMRCFWKFGNDRSISMGCCRLKCHSDNTYRNQ